MVLLGQLKRAGMRAAYDAAVAAGVRAQHPFPRIFGELLLAQLADHRARSTAYRMGVARFPVMKNLAEFDFAVSPVNHGLVRELHEGGFLATQRNAVLIGGTGTGKSHIAIAIGANCVRNGARVRFFTAIDFTAIDLVNQLAAEARAGKAGKLADQLVRVDLVVLDELG
jgi:DNA replication protein DnaC